MGPLHISRLRVSGKLDTGQSLLTTTIILWNCRSKLTRFVTSAHCWISSGRLSRVARMRSSRKHTRRHLRAVPARTDGRTTGLRTSLTQQADGPLLRTSGRRRACQEIHGDSSLHSCIAGRSTSEQPGFRSPRLVDGLRRRASVHGSRSICTAWPPCSASRTSFANLSSI